MEIGLSIVGTLAVVAVVLFLLRYQKCGGDFAKLRQGEELAQRFMSEATVQEAVAWARSSLPSRRSPRSRRRSHFCC